jgi:zinc protease
MRGALLSFAAFALGLAAQPVPDYKALKYPPLRQVTPPAPVFFTLPNGMKVFLLEDHELPLISGSVLVRTGNLFDPADKRGLADLTGSIIRSGGTKSKSGDDLDDELESIAASVESSIGESSGSVSFNCLKENSDQVLGIFKDVLTTPEFREDKVELGKTQARSGISRRNDDAAGIASREFSDTVYGRDTPWGWTIEYDDINRIKREDMVAFHRRYFFPKKLILWVYGDF